MTQNPLSIVAGFDAAVDRAWATVDVREDLAHALRSHRRQLRPSGAAPSRDLVARDNAGRRLPAHLVVKPANAFPPDWWWARNGGWLTTRARPAWRYERRGGSADREGVPTSRGVSDRPG
ncbi:hypothetical protein [Luteipulveratus flavus]|uniref:Uncharacterized protein n=1 Tax=Luteipulveratus flavus TaxID=3031728 RepID=A0ABT6C3Z3_9MICO|nr:hypothetical protein [Luteipulveratus sp. YIM 133296]MDF8263528.1 hypothetical protein [Luteipulveratus sp. YIM 133296]